MAMQKAHGKALNVWACIQWHIVNKNSAFVNTACLDKEHHFKFTALFIEYILLEHKLMIDIAM